MESSFDETHFLLTCSHFLWIAREVENKLRSLVTDAGNRISMQEWKVYLSPFVTQYVNIRLIFIHMWAVNRRLTGSTDVNRVATKKLEDLDSKWWRAHRKIKKQNKKQSKASDNKATTRNATTYFIFFEEIKQDKPFKLFARLLHFNDFYSQASYLLAAPKSLSRL